LVCLAHRYQKALKNGNVEAGSVPVPSSDEARREISYRGKG